MIRVKNMFISDVQPPIKEGLWLKVTSEGVILYFIEAGTPKPLKLVDDQGTASVIDDTIQNLVGSVSDAKTDNTINGAKAYAKNQADTLKGASGDESSEMTLYGLKAYVDEQIASLG